MVPVAGSEGVTIHCPSRGLFSLYNSPYPAHRLSTGVDVYPDADFHGLAPSPVRGVVLEIRRVRSPRGRGFEASGHDVVILLQSEEEPSKVVKLLHVEPSLSVGDSVQVGDELGSLLRSGYYGFGTSPHVHVEVREPSDPLRARGGHRVERLLKIGDAPAIDELKGVVTRSTAEFSLLRLDLESCGLPAEVGGVTGILDGGIPYYGWLGVHIDSKQPEGSDVVLLGHNIAHVESALGGTCIASCTDFSVSVEGKPILGLSLRLSPVDDAEVKLIPRRLGSLTLEEGSEATVKVEEEGLPQ